MRQPACIRPGYLESDYLTQYPVSRKDQQVDAKERAEEKKQACSDSSPGCSASFQIIYNSQTSWKVAFAVDRIH